MLAGTMKDGGEFCALPRAGRRQTMIARTAAKPVKACRLTKGSLRKADSLWFSEGTSAESGWFRTLASCSYVGFEHLRDLRWQHRHRDVICIPHPLRIPGPLGASDLHVAEPECRKSAGDHR